MKTRKELTLRDIGELAAIKRICRHLPGSKSLIRGIGDDCAVVRPCAESRYDWLLTSDAVIEGTHFKPGTTPSAIGHKAIARVLSDIASMGGKPQWALINLVAPSKTLVKVLDGIYSGAGKLARKHKMAIAGGDTTRGPVIELHVFVVGTTPKNTAVLRSGARSGDIIFVTDSLGGSRRRKHLSFDPRINEGLFLRKWATAMIDVSDGLASDLRHITDMSKTGARLDLNLIPVSSDARKGNNAISALNHAIYDGEDFELLFTVRPGKAKLFQSAWKKNFKLPCTEIGYITSQLGVIEYTDKNRKVRKLEKTGFQHFKN